MFFLSKKPVMRAAFSILLLIAACSSQPSAPVTPSITPTTFPTYAFNPPTEAPQVATAAAVTAAAATQIAASGEIVLDPERVERGLGRYEALECGACHGADGTGGEDGPALVTYNASQDQFIDFMRTGGTLGESHRYPAERLSPSGIVNLYQYILSLE